MLFVLIGVAVIALHLAGIGVFGTLELELLRRPLGGSRRRVFLAAVWWDWSDVSGLSKRREMARMEQEEGRLRRKESLAALGMDTRARRKAQKQQR